MSSSTTPERGYNNPYNPQTEPASYKWYEDQHFKMLRLNDRLQSQSLPAVEKPEKEEFDPYSEYAKELMLMTSMVDQIGRDNTASTRGMVKIRLAGQIDRLFKSQQPSQPEGKTLEEPFGYVFENRFYKNLDQMSGQTFSEGNEPLAVYANQPCKEWISVEDRLPEDVGYYLCFDLKNYTGPVISGFFSRLWNPDISKVMQITHWQHLPAHPQK